MEREPWEVFSLPAIARHDEFYLYGSILGNRVFARKAGEAVHPERDSVETSQKIRETVGEYIFSCQYQQDPMPVEGGPIKQEWLRYYTPEQLPNYFDFILQSWDNRGRPWHDTRAVLNGVLWTVGTGAQRELRTGAATAGRATA